MDSQQRARRNLVIAIVVILAAAVVLVAVLGRPNSPTGHAPASTDVSYPFNSKLPVQTPHYKISYSYDTASKTFLYQVTLYAIINGPSDYPTYVQELKQYKAEALSWIKAQGQDPSKLQITYLPAQAADL